MHVCMYVCMYVLYVCLFISLLQQQKLKHKNTSKADKKEAVKHTNNTLYRYNKCHYDLHAYCTLELIGHLAYKSYSAKLFNSCKPNYASYLVEICCTVK